MYGLYMKNNLTLTDKVQKKFILKILTPSYLDIIWGDEERSPADLKI